MQPTLIELRQETPGFDRFIGSWVFPLEKTVVVDVGPSRSISHLIRSLEALGIRRVDTVLLTHIHLDHAGGLAEFLDHYPMAQAVCHDKAIPHLVDPSRLWQGSLKTLGGVAEAYGPIRPVQRNRLISHTEARDLGLEIIETPGHAPHHLSFILEGNLFAGEAGGIYLAENGWEYLRPATPPVFFLREFLQSIDRLLSKQDLPLCYAHFGKAQSSHRMLRREKAQLLLWERLIGEESATGQADLLEKCIRRLLEEDPELRAFERMSGADQEKERFFLANSIKGFLGFLQRNQKGGPLPRLRPP